MLKKQIKKILLPLACRTVLAPKSFKVPKGVRQISCSDEDIQLMINTSNNVYRLKTEDGIMYFRECKLHSKIHRYVGDLTEYYYTYICPEQAYDRQFVEKALSDKKNFKKFANMGMVNVNTSGAYQFCVNGDAAAIGLQGADDSMINRLKDFVQFIWGDLFSYTLNGGIVTDGYQIYNAVRSVATRRMAEALNLSELIPVTEFVQLCIVSRPPIFGTLMAEAPGICMEKMSVEERIKVSSPALQRALNNLNILDVLCLERDHRVGNYNVVLKDGKVIGVTAFDNDSPKSFGMGGISFTTYMGCSPWALGNCVNRPYVDKALADSILNFDEKKLKHITKDLLNAFQLFALKCRIRKVKKLLSSLSQDRFLTETEWTEDTFKEEISGRYGDTYLVKFLQAQKLMPQPWITDR